MLLSACMIVKNEEWTIKRCLESLQGLVDEIIVVDTGSTDQTIEIVQSYGCKIITYEWDNDFSHARNAGITHASGDWILVIDADEFVESISRQTIAQYLEMTDAEGVFINVKSLMGPLAHPTSTLAIRVMRLFRNRHLYTGAIHEQIADSVFKTKLPIDKFDLSLVHLGYTNEFVQFRTKSKRNTTLIEQSIAQDPDNLFHATNLMAEYSISGQYQKCAELSEKTWKLVKSMPQNAWPNYAPRMISLLVSSLWELKKIDKSFTYMDEAIRYFPWFTDFKKRYADMLATQGHYKKAISQLMACREQGDTQLGLIEFLEGAGTYYAAYSLGMVWSQVGDDLNARKWFLQAFFENPSIETALIPIIGLLPKESNLLHEYIEPKLYDPTALATYAEVYASWNYPDAQEVVDRIEKRFGESEATHRAHMSILLNTGGTEALFERAERVNYDIDWLLLGIHCLDIGDEEKANYALARAKVRGEYVVKVKEIVASSMTATWGLSGVIRDFIAIHAETLLEKWLLQAIDIDQYWITLKCSPLQQVMQKIVWKGCTVQECEQNALNFFHQRQWEKSEEWLMKSKQYEPSVTQFLLECDLALAKNDVQTARKIIFSGKNSFPDSEMLKIASDKIHTKLNPTELFQPLRSRLS
ncbi:glycosyltransferase family 2 protein [Sulfoacidibacillus ferrooxidans]|uniref:Glycosyltransferase 2-like domain-containing protein n=1 Tax=Sulfoacidibacillus ferrooxidans TaxID=2005001 RepID=A0A9X1VBA8_9BACL|nr:glycosyltransferase family 2 protein [Sulfoacidibacillus ferrooxidans]MCI0183478.1 hypothetical protein [Sulfoacidibacillus ferrooxidans]